MERTEIRLSAHFSLSELLRSSAVPEVARYAPTSAEVASARALARDVLEPLRAFVGSPITITGGARPDGVRNAQGQSFDEALRDRGDSPAEHSDHKTFNGVDAAFRGTADSYRAAYEWVQRLPGLRQVILYLRTGPGGELLPHHLHVAAVVPGRPRVAPPNFAFVVVDGRRAAGPGLYT